MKEVSSGEPEPTWESLAPHLDTLLQQLKPDDRDVVLLRYFQQKSAREIAGVLGLSEEAAQKRTARALDRLRSAFQERGVMASSAMIAAMLGANAVQAAPASLQIGIAAAAAASHGAVSAGLIKVITMTTIQKVALNTVVVTVALGGAVYEAQRAARLERKLAVLQQQPQQHVPQSQSEPLTLAPPTLGASQTNAMRFFDWREVESPDYRHYLANLRAIGCPEKTIRDIILADVNDLYRQRLRDAMPSNRFEYWKAGNPFAQLASAVVTNAQAFAGERRQLVATLLGGQAWQGADSFSTIELYQTVNEHVLDFLSPDKLTGALEVETDFSARLSNLNKNDRKSYKQMLAQKDAALLNVLTSDEKFEYDLRRSASADGLRVALRGVEVTEEEFRNLVRLQKSYDDHYGPPRYAPEGPEAAGAAKSLEENAMKVLGKERYQVFWANKHPSK